MVSGRPGGLSLVVAGTDSGSDSVKATVERASSSRQGRKGTMVTADD
jgi:hypothetical protein